MSHRERTCLLAGWSLSLLLQSLIGRAHCVRCSRRLQWPRPSRWRHLAGRMRVRMRPAANARHKRLERAAIGPQKHSGDQNERLFVFVCELEFEF